MFIVPIVFLKRYQIQKGFKIPECFVIEKQTNKAKKKSLTTTHLAELVTLSTECKENMLLHVHNS